MKHNIFAASLFGLLVLATAVPTRANSCAAGDSIKPATLIFTSLEGTATLCGISEYTTPSSPPKKYRRQDISGTIKYCTGGSPDCSAPGNSGERVYSGSYRYSQDNCSVLNTQKRDIFTLTPESGSSYSWNATDPATTLRITASVDPVLGSPGTYLLHSYSGIFQSNQSNAFIRMVIRNSAGVALVVAGNNNGNPSQFSAQQVGAGSTIEFIDAGSQLTVTGTVQPWLSGTPCGGQPVLVGTIGLQENLTDYSGPLFYAAGGVTVATTPTKTTWTADGICGTNGSGTKQSGSLIKELSDEDTEEDAEKRASTVPGTSNTAFRVGRTTGFSFGFRKVEYEAGFNVDCAGEYDAVVTYSTALRIAPFTTGTDTQVVRDSATRQTYHLWRNPG